ncbi:hypothetical protein AB0F17_35855 [Nonomuraea sp. NPDC026600]
MEKKIVDNDPQSPSADAFQMFPHVKRLTVHSKGNSNGETANSK